MNLRSLLEDVRVEKSGKSPSTELTKPTKPPFVSFASKQIEPFR